MKKYILITLILIIACTNQKNNSTKIYRNAFTDKEKTILRASREIIKNAYFGSFISLNKENYPKSREVEPLSPNDKFVIYFATKPNTRKVNEVSNNPKTAFHFFDKSQLGYVSLYGKSVVITNKDSIKNHWNRAWDRYYPNKKYVLIKFVSEYLEMVNIKTGLTGNSTNWRPEKVILRK